MTNQISEKLIYQQQEYDLEECPFFPKDGAQVSTVGRDEFEDTDGLLLSTACWREYLGTWEIKQGQLYLNNIDGRYKLVEGKPIVADWFSGELVVQCGELLDMNIEADIVIYSHERRITIEKGEVVADQLIDKS